MILMYSLPSIVLLCSVLCPAERVHSAACGGKVRQDGSGQFAPAEESPT